MRSHRRYQPLGIRVPSTLNEISVRSYEMGGHFAYDATTGQHPHYVGQDVLQNGAILVSSWQKRLYGYLENKNYGLPDLIASDDSALWILEGFKVPKFAPWLKEVDPVLVTFREMGLAEAILYAPLPRAATVRRTKAAR